MAKPIPDYTPSNQQAARLILADPARYGGPEALPVVWARLVLSRGTADAVRPTRTPQQGNLFEERAA